MHSFDATTTAKCFGNKGLFRIWHYFGQLLFPSHGESCAHRDTLKQRIQSISMSANQVMSIFNCWKSHESERSDAPLNGAETTSKIFVWTSQIREKAIPPIGVAAAVVESSQRRTINFQFGVELKNWINISNKKNFQKPSKSMTKHSLTVTSSPMWMNPKWPHSNS